MLNGNRVIAIRARARRGWSIRKIARTFDVSRKAVRRYARLGATPCGSQAQGLLSVRQELELVRRSARQWDRRDPDELESALTDKLAEIYSRKTDASNWKAFLTKSLKTTAINWLRARKRRESHFISVDPLDAPEGDRQAHHVERAAVVDLTARQRRFIKRSRRRLSPFLGRVWDALVAENFNQTRAAIRLGVNRNTIGNAIREIRKVRKRRRS